MIDRRGFLGTSLTVSAWPLLPGLSLAKGLPDRKLVVVFLRGGMDGLGAAPPYADADYFQARGQLALAADELIELNGFFGLHPALDNLGRLYQQGELLVLPASASPYRSRSHFDAQDLLENGSTQPRGRSSGWLNRAMQLLHGELAAIAIGGGIPLILRGQAPVQSWSPSRFAEPDQDFLQRVLGLYQQDPVLHAALSSRLAMADDVAGGGSSGKPLLQNARMAARVLRTASAPNLAVLALSGWDTHTAQGRRAGRLATALRHLNRLIGVLRQELQGDWQRTAVLVMTEFGRTVAPNGSGGTDHGTASVAFLAGGLVNGGRVIGDWPGLSTDRLFEGRDLYPANDLRALCKGLLHELYGLPLADLEREVFPGSADAGVLRALLSE